MMTGLMQTASALTLAAALAAVPMIAHAQQATETQAEQAVENAAQETQEAGAAAADAAGEAVEATGEALDNAADATTEAAGEAVQEVDQALENTPEAAEAQAEQVEEAAEQEAEAIEETAEEQAEAVEQAGEEQAEAIEEGAVVVEGEAAVEEVEGAITMQEDNSIFTSDLIGATVYNPAFEKIGEVDDAILSLDGTIRGIVIGVGGFLGLGEKHVAVEVQQLSVQANEDGEPQLFLDSTREALEAAPEFVTVADQRDQANRVEAEQAPVAENATESGLATSDAAPAGTAPVLTEPPAVEGAEKPVQN